MQYSSTCCEYQIALVGDSDIAFWPNELYPSINLSVLAASSALPSSSSSLTTIPHQSSPQLLVSGHSGATLAEIIPHVRAIMSEWKRDSDGTNNKVMTTSSSSNLIIVACAGENDIGNGIPLSQSVSALTEFLDVVFDCQNGTNTNDRNSKNPFVIFLGPKFEPWLEQDSDSKRQYSAMSRAFERCCREYKKGDSGHQQQQQQQQVYYVDCLTMFCGETAHIPGAVLGGRATADDNFFASDQLHLSYEGYSVWKEVVEHVIEESILRQHQQ
jgi:lysophospholipase L1-like esterase